MKFSFGLLMPGGCGITFVDLKWAVHEFTPGEMRSMPTVDKIQFRAGDQLKAYTSQALSDI